MKTKELLKKVKANDSDAFEEILRQYKPMIYSFIQANRLELGDYSINKEDLLQEGIIALHQACLLYDEQNEASFHTFAHLVVQRRIKRIFMQNYRRYQHERYSIDAVEDGMTYRNIASEKTNDNPNLALMRKENNALLRRCYDSLSPVERNIVILRENHYSYKEISERLNMSQKTVDNKIQKIRRRFKRLKDFDDFDNEWH